MLVGILTFPGVQQLDLTGPFEVFATLPGAQIQLLWKEITPIHSATGLILQPTMRLDDCRALDVICIPGGTGTTALLEDQEVHDFVRRVASTAQFVTAVCTGALVLGAAGLLLGRRATTHWMSLDLLERFGATPIKSRVVRDGQIITAGGVTAGIDFALSVIAELKGEPAAEEIQLMLEYAPEPPFHSGSPDTATPAALAGAQSRLGPMRKAREDVISTLSSNVGRKNRPDNACVAGRA